VPIWTAHGRGRPRGRRRIGSHQFP